ncbi:polysaccharide lyase family 4 protein [Mycena olivaceomarginata]|nr:polysaccharide lyase family 4 protein [Mycena olivaceomarginata]
MLGRALSLLTFFLALSVSLFLASVSPYLELCGRSPPTEDWCSQSTNGDITSLLYNGIHAQDPTKFSQLSSGLGAASCSWVQTGTGCRPSRLTRISSSSTTSTLTQYYVAQRGVAAIHMATYTTAEPTVGELRFIARLLHTAVPNGIPQSNTLLVDGINLEVYSGVPFINDQVHGVTGSGIGVYMVIPGAGYESSSGGPFFKDINNQGGAQQELYFYMNSGHTQTEANRMGLHGPYALWFTTGAAPSGTVDTSFWGTLGAVSGLVLPAARGFVEGKAIGVPAAYAADTVVGWSNSVAQYCLNRGFRARANAATSNFFSPAMKPSTYTMTMYKGELAVRSQVVLVNAGTTISSNIHDTSVDDHDPNHAPERLPHAHLGPRHVHCRPTGNWVLPMAIFQDIGPVTIRFALQSGQGGARTLKIATNAGVCGRAAVNTWNSAIPAVPSQPDSRGVTRGVYRGNNIEYTYAIPTGILFTGSTINVITISVASGSSGDTFLSPNIVFDALALF